MAMTDAPQADRLTALQRLRGATQTQMAVDLGVSGSYLSQVKSGSRPISTELAHRASTVYRVPMSFFWCSPNPIRRDAGDLLEEGERAGTGRAQVVETYNEALRLFRHAATMTTYRAARLPDPRAYNNDVETIAGCRTTVSRAQADTPIKNMTRPLREAWHRRSSSTSTRKERRTR